MTKTPDFYHKAIKARTEIFECIQSWSSGLEYSIPGQVEWSPETGPIFVPEGKTLNYESIKFPYCSTRPKVAFVIEQDRGDTSKWFVNMETFEVLDLSEAKGKYLDEKQFFLFMDHLPIVVTDENDVIEFLLAGGVTTWGQKILKDGKQELYQLATLSPAVKGDKPVVIVCPIDTYYKLQWKI